MMVNMFNDKNKRLYYFLDGIAKNIETLGLEAWGKNEQRDKFVYLLFLEKTGVEQGLKTLFYSWLLLVQLKQLQTELKIFLKEGIFLDLKNFFLWSYLQLRLANKPIKWKASFFSLKKAARRVYYYEDFTYRLSLFLFFMFFYNVEAFRRHRYNLYLNQLTFLPKKVKWVLGRTFKRYEWNRRTSFSLYYRRAILFGCFVIQRSGEISLSWFPHKQNILKKDKHLVKFQKHPFLKSIALLGYLGALFKLNSCSELFNLQFEVIKLYKFWYTSETRKDATLFHFHFFRFKNILKMFKHFYVFFQNTKGWIARYYVFLFKDIFLRFKGMCQDYFYEQLKSNGVFMKPVDYFYFVPVCIEVVLYYRWRYFKYIERISVRKNELKLRPRLFLYWALARKQCIENMLISSYFYFKPSLYKKYVKQVKNNLDDILEEVIRAVPFDEVAAKKQDLDVQWRMMVGEQDLALSWFFVQVGSNFYLLGLYQLKLLLLWKLLLGKSFWFLIFLKNRNRSFFYFYLFYLNHYLSKFLLLKILLSKNYLWEFSFKKEWIIFWENTIKDEIIPGDLRYKSLQEKRRKKKLK